MKVSIPTEYVMGHLRYGHWEVDVTPEEYEALKRRDESVMEEVLDNATFFVDDYRIDGVGPLDISEMEVIEE